MRTYISPYGNPLVYTGEPGERPILTCENYCKWYALFAVLPDGTIDRVDFPGQDDRFPDSEITCRTPTRSSAWPRSSGGTSTRRRTR
jgi:hypothetical protein